MGEDRINKEERSSVRGDIFRSISQGVRKAIPGGIRPLDSLVTQGPNRDLYVSRGRCISPAPGISPAFNKSLLVGTPRRVSSRKRKTLIRRRLF